MQINVTYDASAATAPAGFAQAVDAAVQFFDSAISSNITVNIAFGWGEVDGVAMGSGSLGESSSNFFNGYSYSAVRADLAKADAGSPGSAAAIQGLPTTDPTNGGNFWIATAEAKALGLIAGHSFAAEDGFVGINASLAYTFDPNNRAVPGQYDAIGILEHEISEVLGRQVFASGIYPAGSDLTPLDLFRYWSANTHSYSPGPSSFSLNGDQMLRAFNNSNTKGGDDGDWASSDGLDAFNAFGQTGILEPVSAVDLRVLELLGYHISDTAPTTNGVAVAPLVVTQDGGLGAGQTLNFDGASAVLLSAASASAGPSYVNAGTIIDSGIRSAVDVVGVRADASAAVLNANAVSTFTNAASGTLSVTAVGLGSDAVGVYYGAHQVVNAGAIQVVSNQSDAWGVVGAVYTGLAGGALAVQAADHAFGVLAAPVAGATVSNAGVLSVSGVNTAYGLDLTPAGAVSVNNSGVISAQTSAANGTANGILLTIAGAVSLFNSGSISATGYVPPYNPGAEFQAIRVDQTAGSPSPSAVTISNSGAIHGTIDLSDVTGGGVHVINTGLIFGTVRLGPGGGVFDASSGSQVAKVYGGSGNDTISGSGGGAEYLNGGYGGIDEISFASADAGVTVSLALQGQAQDTVGAGIETLLGFHILVGSAFNDTLEGYLAVDGGGGVNTLSYAHTLYDPYAFASYHPVDTSIGVTVNLALQGSVQNIGYFGNSTLSNFQNIVGSSVNDTLTGDSNNNVIDGGAGNDRLDGGGGVDTVSYASATSGVTVSLALAGQAQNTGGDGVDTLSNFANLTGSAFNDTLEGDANNNFLDGGGWGNTASYAHAGSGVAVSLALQGGAQNTIGAGSDTLVNFQNLTGSAYNDTLEGDANNNVLDGGGGINTASYAHAASGVAVSLDLAWYQNTGGAGADALFNIQNLTGSAYNDTLEGDANNNVLDGGGGVNTASYAHAGAGVAVSLALQGAPQDTVGAGTDTLSNFANLTGSAYNDTLEGDANANVLDGGGGTNTLSYAHAGAGVTVGLAVSGAQNTVGAGTDTLFNFQNLTGSAYNDTLEGDAGANVLDGGAGANTVSYAHAAYGVAVSLALQGSAQNTLGAGSDLLSRFQNLTGSAFDDILAGDANANVLDGGAGINTVSYADATAGVTVSLALQGAAQATGGAGTDTLFNFANLTGSAFNDALTGDANANGLTGGGGDDTLTGNGGADTFVFGQGGGADVVTDFSHAQGDRIGLSAFTGLHTLADVQAIATQSGADAVLSLPGGGSLTLDNVNIGALTRSDVLLTGTFADFFGAGLSNLVWQNTSGAIAVWSVSGQALSGAILPIATPGWHLQDTGDFNGDGKSGDLLFRDGAGEVAIWQMNGLQLQSPAIVATVPIDWQIQGTGDFNGDGKSDILWRNLTTGDVAVWQMNGVQIQSPAVVARIPLDWHVVGSGDFNGDGKSDILWRNATSGDVAIWQMNGAQIQTPAVVATIPLSWHIAAAGDFNGDGKADLLWQNSDTGQVAIWEMNGVQLQTPAVIATLPTDWKVIGTADVNGDGKSDILWQHAATGQTAVWEMNGLAVVNPFYLAQVDHSWSVLDHHFDWV